MIWRVVRDSNPRGTCAPAAFRVRCDRPDSANHPFLDPGAWLDGILIWRSERDSNPRDGFPPTHFPGVRLRPLGHRSILAVSGAAKVLYRHEILAETEGFEPSRRFPACTLSRGVPSTTRPRLRVRVLRPEPVSRFLADATRPRNLFLELETGFEPARDYSDGLQIRCRQPLGYSSPIPWCLEAPTVAFAAGSPRSFRLATAPRE
jgi:hypothetical protein